MAEARNDILLDGVHTDIPTIQYNIHTIFLNLRFHWKQSLVPIFFEMIRTNRKFSSFGKVSARRMFCIYLCQSDLF